MKLILALVAIPTILFFASACENTSRPGGVSFEWPASTPIPPCYPERVTYERNCPVEALTDPSREEQCYQLWATLKDCEDLNRVLLEKWRQQLTREAGQGR